jgi:uncharacterized protein (TIGR02466 family)
MSCKAKYISLFPTLVYKIEEFISEEQCKDIINHLNTDLNYAEHGALIGNAKSTHKEFNNNIIEAINTLPSCVNFITKIEQVLNDYSEQAGTELCKLSNSWINKQEKGSILQEHTHPGSILSGGLYLNVDKDSSPLYFHNPNNFAYFQNINKYTEYACHWYTIQPKNGDLIVFPSWLRHGSNNKINQTDGRIVLSFNSNPCYNACK